MKNLFVRRILCSLCLIALCAASASADTTRFIFRVEAGKEIPGNFIVDFRQRLSSEENKALIDAALSGDENYRKFLESAPFPDKVEPVISIAVMKPEVPRDLDLPPETKFFATTSSKYPGIVLQPTVSREGNTTRVTVKVLDGRWLTINGTNRTDSNVTLLRRYPEGTAISPADSLLTLPPGESSFRVRSPKFPFDLHYMHGNDYRVAREVSVAGNDTDPLSLRIAFENGDLKVTCVDCPTVFEHRRSDSLLLLGCDGKPKVDAFSPPWAVKCELRVIDEQSGRLDRFLLDDHEQLRFARTSLGRPYSPSARWEIVSLGGYRPPYQYSEPIDLTESPTAIVMRLPVEGVEVQGVPALCSQALRLDDNTSVSMTAESDRFSKRTHSAHLILPCGFQGVVRIQQKNEMEGVDVPIDLTGSQRTFTVAPEHHWNRYKPKD